MNLNYNCRENIYMEPDMNIYAEVRNRVLAATFFFKVTFFYNGQWVTGTSLSIKYGKHKRLYYQRSSSNRQIYIYKKTDQGDLFIFNTMLLSEDSVCYKLTGSTVHSLINEVQC